MLRTALVAIFLCAATTITFAQLAAPDLALSLSQAPSIASIGELVTFTLTLSNAGSTEATGATVTSQVTGGLVYFSSSTVQGTLTENAGAITWSAGTLAPGTTAQATLILTAMAPGQFLTSASAACSETEPNLLNNNAFSQGTVSPRTFLQAGGLLIGRKQHTATLLNDGKILVVGGTTSTGMTATAEIYDPSLQSSTFTGSLNYPRNALAAARLGDGRVLITGYASQTNRAEIYDPATGKFTLAGAQAYPSTQGHTATLLQNGKVLVAGGYLTTGGYSPYAELFDPATGLFSSAPSMSTSRCWHTATLLTDGSVLIAGAYYYYASSAVADIYNAEGTSVAQSVNSPGMAENWGACRLQDGRVLLTGYNRSMLYDMTTRQFTSGPSMLGTRWRGISTLLPDGSVLVCCGWDYGSLARAELFSPETSAFTRTVDLSVPRDQASATSLADGRIFVIGGEGDPGGGTVIFSSVECYDAARLKAPPEIAIQNVTVVEGNGPATNAVFQLSLSQRLGIPVSVAFATSALDSTPDYDYASTNGTIVFPPDTTNITVSVAVLGNVNRDPTRSFALNLSNATNAVITVASATCTIEDDDAQPFVLPLAASVLEPNVRSTNMAVQVTLSASSFEIVSAGYHFEPGTAQDGLDFLATNGVIVFGPRETNKTIYVPVLGDTFVETNEQFLLVIDSVTNGFASGPVAETIVSDDGNAGVVDHFVFDLPPAPIYETLHWPVTVSARDASGELATNFNGRVRLTGGSSGQPSYWFDFEEGALDGWTTLNTGPTAGPYVFRLMDVNADGDSSYAFGLSYDNGGVDGIEHPVELKAGVKYVISADFAKINEGGGAYGGDGTVSLMIGQEELAKYGFGSTIWPGQVFAARLVANFVPPTNGIYTLRIGFVGGFGENGGLKIFVDDISVAAPVVTPSFVSLTNGVWSGAVAASEGVTNFTLVADDTDGHFGQSAAFDILNYADLWLTSTVSPSPGRVGSNLTYAITVMNTGPGIAKGVRITTTLQPELPLVSLSSTKGTCSSGGQSVFCDVPVLKTGESSVMTVITRPTLPITITNLAEVASTSFDTLLVNNVASNQFSISPPLLYVTGPVVAERAGASTTAQFVVSVGTPYVQDIEVDYATANGTALAGSDYLPVSGHLTFSSGIMNRMVTVQILDDLSNEPDETFAMNLFNPVNAQLAYSGTTNCIIRDNFDPIPGITVNDAAGPEGNSGTNNSLAFTATLSQPSGKTVTAYYVFLPGSAVAGRDYTNSYYPYPPYTLTFPPNTSTQTIYLPIIGDTVNELDETVFLVMTNTVSNAVVLRQRATGTILNDDAGPGQLDHFEWSTIPSPVLKNTSFPVTLRARDALNNLYTGPVTNIVNLSGRLGAGNVAIAVSPNTAGGIVNGVWNGSMTVSSTYTNLVLQADDATGRIGRSNPFNVVAPLTLMVSLPAAAREGNGLLAGAGTVFIPQNTGTPLTIQLLSRDTTEITVPATVTIPAGTNRVAFDITVVDDTLLDGPQNAVITATANTYLSGVASMTVNDNESANITVTGLPPTLKEQSANYMLAVNLSAPVDDMVSVALTSSNPSRFSVPTNLVFSPGDSSRGFLSTVIDDTSLSGSEVIALTAHVDYWSDGVATTTITDNDTNRLTLQVSPLVPFYTEGQGYLTNITLLVGGALRTNLPVTFTSSVPSKLGFPSSFEIPAGVTSVRLPVAVLDDADFDGTRSVTLSVSAPGFVGTSTNLTVRDNDVHHYVLSALPNPVIATSPFSVTAQARDINDQAMSTVSRYLTFSAFGAKGPVPLSVSSVTLVNGSWTGNISVPTWEHENVVLTVSDSEVCFVQSSPFNVSPPESLLTSVYAQSFVYSELTHMIYACYTNTGILTPIEPFYGVPGTPVPISSMAGKLTISDGGKYLFASLISSNRICQIDAETLEVVKAWNLDGMTVEDMCGVQGSPEAVAISRRAGNGSPHFGGVAIYDNGRMRKNVAGGFLGSNVIEPSGTPGRLYGYDNESSPAMTQVLNYDSEGLTIRGSWGSLQGFDVDIACRGGLIFSTSGKIFDPLRNTQVGTFSGTDPVVADEASGRFYINDWPDLIGYDLKTLMPIGKTTTGLSGSGLACVRWGSNGIAFRAGSRVALVRTPLIASGPPADLVLSIKDADRLVPASQEFTYTLTVSNAGPNIARGVVVTATLSTDAQFISASATSGLATQATGGLVCPLLTISNGAAASVNITLKPLRGGFLTSLVSVTSDSLDPNLANNSTTCTTQVGSALQPDGIVELAIPANDLVFDTNSGRLFMSIPNSDRLAGNSILPLNPETGAFEARIAMAQEPTKLAVSEDGRFLYVGINSDNSVQRVNLAQRTNDLRFPTGYGNVADMLVLPGSPESIIATCPNTLAVYDNGVRRTNVVGATPYNYEYYLCLSASNSLAYEGTPYALRRIGIDLFGAIELPGLGDPYIYNYERTLRYDSGLIYSSGGRIFDPETPNLTATLPFVGFPCPDSKVNKAFYLTVSGTTATIHAIQLGTFTEVGSVAVSNISGSASSLLRWGLDGLAFRTTGGQVFLLRTRFADDRDNDTLPDSWELRYFSSVTSPGSGPADDPDGDTMSNEQEMRLGLNPVTFDAVRFMSQRSLTNGAFELTVLGRLGSKYALFASADLQSWVPITNFTCTSILTTLFDAGATNYPNRYYSLRPQDEILPPSLLLTRTPSDLKLLLQGFPGIAYAVQTSTNLKDWTVMTNLVSTNAAMPVRTIPANSEPGRFYRANVR